MLNGNQEVCKFQHSDDDDMFLKSRFILPYNKNQVNLITLIHSVYMYQ